MLTPEYLETVGDDIGGLFDATITEILVDIAQRILAAKEIYGDDEIYETPSYLIRKLKELGVQQEYINEKLGELLNTSTDKVKELMKTSSKLSTDSSFSLLDKAGYDTSGLSFRKQILKGTKALNGELTNLTRTTANLASKTYSDALDKAYLECASGAYSFDEATKHAIQTLTKNGIGTITYDSGATRTVESAVRVAVRTSVNQNALACEKDIIDELGINLVETSSHLGARPSHEVWQGKIFWTKHAEGGYQNFYKATGYGTGEGLGGYNCRHAFYPYIPEFGEQTYKPVDHEANEKLYNDTQKQRYHERKIREWDRKKQILEAGGQDSTTAQQWKNYHQNEIDKLVKHSKGLQKRNYAAEKGYAAQEKITFSNKSGQEYKSFSINKNESIVFPSASKVKATAYRISGSNDIYVEDGVHLTRRNYHKIRKELSEVYKTMGIENAENLPKVILVGDTAISKNALADYNAANNTLRIFAGLGDRKQAIQLLQEQQSGEYGSFAMWDLKKKMKKGDAKLTLAHEMYHWKDGQYYKNKFGPITDENYFEYLDNIDKINKKHIDRLKAEGYNINRISSYSNTMFEKNNSDEAWTEYRALTLFGGKLWKD